MVSRVSPSRPCTWDHTVSVQGDPLQTLHLGTHVHHLQGDPLQTLPWGHTSSVSRVIPSRPCTWDHMSTIPRVTTTPRPNYCSCKSTVSLMIPSQIVRLGAHVHSLQGEPPPQMLHFESHVHSPQGDPTFQTLHCGHIHSLPGYRVSKTQYWVHMSSVSRVIPSQTMYLVSHVKGFMVTPFKCCIWDHTSTVPRMTILPRPCT